MRTALATVLLVLSCAASPAFANACSGKDHTRASGMLGGVLSGGLTNSKATGGALLDGLAGNAIARDMDCEDQPYAARAYDQSFRGPPGRRYEWNRGRNRGYVMTNREYYRGPRLCRDFTQVVYRSGREFDRSGTACRRQNGEWEFL